MNFAPPRSSPPRRAAFTLLESLLVMVILVVLLALVVSSARSFNEGIGLARASQIVVDQIEASRQQASAHNWTVYVYLYKLPGVSPVGYSALQLWRAAPPTDNSAAPAMLPLDKAYVLPSAVVISEDATRNSPLLGLLAAQTNPPPALGNLPPSLAGASSVAYAVGPSGMLALDGGSASAPGAPPTAAARLAACCLTIVPARCGGQTATPANFVTIQINPYTGTPLVYRP